MPCFNNLFFSPFIIARSSGNKYSIPMYTHADKIIHRIENAISWFIASNNAATKHIIIQAKNSGIRLNIIDFIDNLIAI